MLSNKVLEHSIKAIVQNLNGNIDAFKRLSNMAYKQYKLDEYNRKCIVTIGEVTPTQIKNKMYKIASRRNYVC